MNVVLALDIGEKRVGVAIAEPPVFLAHALPTLATTQLKEALPKLIKEREVSVVVIGRPRNQAGETTKQTKFAEELIASLHLGDAIKLVWQDESLTSVKAEEELEARGKPYEKADIDALAATYILEDYLKENR